MAASGVAAAARTLNFRPTIHFRMLPKAPSMCEKHVAADVGDGRPDLIGDVKYEADSRLLLVGEANFSFALALCKHFEECSWMTATSFESRDDLLARFGSRMGKRLSLLEKNLCTVYHSVDAADLPQRFRENSFDCVCFNFPLTTAEDSSKAHVAPPSSDDTEVQRKHHAAQSRETYSSLSVLLTQFFHGASYVLRPGGQCHLRLTDQHATARGLQSAKDYDLSLDERLDFYAAFEQVYKPLGYRPAAVDFKSRWRRHAKAGFDVRHSSTLLFRKADR